MEYILGRFRVNIKDFFLILYCHKFKNFKNFLGYLGRLLGLETRVSPQHFINLRQLIL